MKGRVSSSFVKDRWTESLSKGHEEWCHGRDHKVSKIWLKWDLQLVSKEAPARHHYGEIFQTISRNSGLWGTSQKCLYSGAVVWGTHRNTRRTAWASGGTLFMWGSTDCLECLWSRSSEVFQSQLDMDLDNWLKVALCEQGGWMREPPEVPSNPNHSVILKREPESLDQTSTLHNSKVLYRKEEYWPQNHYILKEGIKDLAANHLTV